MFSMAAIRGKKASGVRASLFVLLLTFYVAGTSNFELLHGFFHSHDHSDPHSEVREEDPCHRAIYHNDVEKGCGHHSHIVVTDKCESCDLIFHTDQILLSHFESQPPPSAPVKFVFCSSDTGSTRQSLLSSRAPPAV
jgi:hypothetical protein